MSDPPALPPDAAPPNAPLSAMPAQAFGQPNYDPRYGGYGGYGHYAHYPQSGGRPGLLTAIGILSIIIASLSLFGSAFTGLYGMMMFRLAQTSAMRSAATVSASSSMVAARPVAATAPRAGGEMPAILAGPDVGPQGMQEADRATVAAALQTMEVMPPPRLRQLDALLAQAGLDIFPQRAPGELPSAPRSAARAVDIAAAISDHGTFLSSDARQADPLYFETAAGRFEIYDDRAVFRPSDSAAPVVRAAAAAAAPAAPTTAPSPVSSAASALPPNPPGGAGAGLTPVQAQTVLQKIQAASGNRLNPAQVSTLRSALAAPGQQLVTPGTLWSPVSMAQVQPDGSVFLKLSGSFLILDAKGQVVNQGSTSMPTFAISPTSIALVVGDALASAALAVYLLISGILLLRGSQRGRRLHQVYALIKIPLAIAGGAGFAWLMSELINSLAAAAGPGASGTGAGAQGMMTFGIVLAFAGLIYPVALLIALRSRTVRDYYHVAARGG